MPKHAKKKRAIAEEPMLLVLNLANPHGIKPKLATEREPPKKNDRKLGPILRGGSLLVWGEGGCESGRLGENRL